MTAPSARGLFRATGKKSKPVAVRSGVDLAGVFEFAEHLGRETDEFYPTPAEPTRAFLAAELTRLRDFSGIWEPACGDGAMVRELNAAGLPTFASDLVDRGGIADQIASFYDIRTAVFPAIVTNPPFAECSWGGGKARWIRHAIEVCQVEYMALLLTWSWPGAGGLARLWGEYPPARVYLMRFRIDFTGQGAPPMLYGWYVWDRAHSGETILRMLDRTDRNQMELFAGVPA